MYKINSSNKSGYCMVALPNVYEVKIRLFVSSFFSSVSFLPFSSGISPFSSVFPVFVWFPPFSASFPPFSPDFSLFSLSPSPSPSHSFRQVFANLFLSFYLLSTRRPMTSTSFQFSIVVSQSIRRVFLAFFSFSCV